MRIFKFFVLSLASLLSFSTFATSLGCLPAVPRASGDLYDWVQVTEVQSVNGKFELKLTYADKYTNYIDRSVTVDVTGHITNSGIQFQTNDERGVILSGLAVVKDNQGKKEVYYDTTLNLPSMNQRFLCFL